MFNGQCDRGLQSKSKFLGVLVALNLSLLLGCGRGPYQPPPRLVEYPEEETAAPAKVDPKKVAAAPAAAQKSVPKPVVPTPPAGRDDDDDASGSGPVIKPDFPTNFADWLPDDFKRARQKRSPKLLQAVRELGTGNIYNPDVESNAKLLSDLLEAPAAEKAISPPPKKVAVGYDDVDEPLAVAPSAIPGLGPAILDSLGVNAGIEARAAIKRILLGKQSSDVDERTLCVATLKALVDHFDVENEKILLAVLTVPDSIRPDGRSQYTADQLHEDCLKAVRPIATADFRFKLAQRMARGVSSPACRKRDMSLLLASDRANVPAKVELATSGIADASERPSMERDLFQASQQLNEHLFRAAPADWGHSKTTRAIPARNGYDEVSQRIPLVDVAASAPYLWRKEFLAATAHRLAVEDEPESRDSLLRLAAAMPSEVVRTALLRRWKANWADEASALGNIGTNFLDPGLLVILKQLPRETQTRVGARQFPDTAQGQKMAKEAAARKSWLRLSEAFMRQLMDRGREFAEHRAATMAAAGTAQMLSSVADFDQFLNSSISEPAANPHPKSTASESKPLELNMRHPKGARPKLVYRSTWPDDLLGKLDSAIPDPIEVCYLRLEVEGDCDAVASNYSGQLKSPVTRQVDNGRWVDSLKNQDDDRISSYDVLITRADRSSEPALRGASEKLIVEVLRVTIRDLSSKAPSTTAVSQRP